MSLISLIKNGSRYCRDVGSKPLWPTSSGLPSEADIPKCNYCSGPMCYEFQVSPALVFFLGSHLDSLVLLVIDTLHWSTTDLASIALLFRGKE